MRAAKIENGIVVNVEMVASLPSGYVASDTANIGFAYDGTIFTPPAIQEATPVPDPGGFIQSTKTALGGIVAANELLKLYPVFLQAVNDQQWDDVLALIVDAQSTGAITAQQYIDFQTALTSHNIPVMLP